MPPFDLPEKFFEHHWRRQPLYLAGGAAAFLPDPPSRDQIFARIHDGASHQSDGATVWFLEGLTDGFPGFPELVDDARRLFEWFDIWCDVFATVGPSSIGCHYDGSDNFSIQLTGNKRWFLCAPEGIHPDDRRRRVLGEPGLGPAAVPESALTFQVRAGDVLYIPSTWIHWGLSDGDSTSVSLVVNVATPFHALQAQVLDSLRRDPRWSTVLPVGPGSAAVRARTLRDLVAEDVPARMHGDVVPRLGGREGSRLSPKGLPPNGGSPASVVDRERVSSYLCQVDPLAADDARLDDEHLRQAARMHARRNLERLLTQCDQRAQRTSNEDSRRIYLAVSATVPTLPAGTLDGLLVDPDVHSWLRAAERDSRFTTAQRAEDPLAHALGLVLLPELARAGSPVGPVTVTLPVDEDGGLTLRRSRLRLRFSGRPARVSLGGLDGVLHYFGPTSATPVVADTDQDGMRVMHLPHADRGGTAVSAAWSDWLGRVAGTPAIGALVPSDDLVRRAEPVTAAIATVNGDMPGHDPFLSWVLVRDSVGATDAMDRMVRRMRGLAVTADSDPALLVRTLARARAWHEIDSLVELFPLAEQDTPAGSDRQAVQVELARAYVWARSTLLGGWDPGCGANQEPELTEDRARWLDRLDTSQVTAWGAAVLDVVQSARR